MRSGAPTLSARDRTPVGIAVLVMVVWGATPIATRLALTDIQPQLVASLRTIVAGLVAIPLLARARQELPRGGGSRRLLAISAATGFVVFPIVYTVGQERTSALHGVMILAALPISGFVLAVIVLGDDLTTTIAVGAVAIIGGVTIAQRS